MDWRELLHELLLSPLGSLIVWYLQRLEKRNRQRISELDTKIEEAFERRPKRSNPDNKGFPPYLKGI